MDVLCSSFSSVLQWDSGRWPKYLDFAPHVGELHGFPDLRFEAGLELVLVAVYNEQRMEDIRLYICVSVTAKSINQSTF